MNDRSLDSPDSPEIQIDESISADCELDAAHIETIDWAGYESAMESSKLSESDASSRPRIESTPEPGKPSTNDDTRAAPGEEYETSNTVLEYVSELIGRLSKQEEESSTDPSDIASWKQEYRQAYEDGIGELAQSREPKTPARVAPPDHSTKNAPATMVQHRPTIDDEARGKCAQQIADMRETANIMAGHALQQSDCFLMIRRGYRYFTGALVALICAQICGNLPLIARATASALTLTMTVLATWWTVCLIRNVVRLSYALPRTSKDLTAH